MAHHTAFVVELSTDSAGTGGLGQKLHGWELHVFLVEVHANTVVLFTPGEPMSMKLIKVITANVYKVSQFVSGELSSSAKRKCVNPHLSVTPSDYAKNSASSADPVVTAPLYAHWFAMDVYNQFHLLKTVLSSDSSSIAVKVGEVQSSIQIHRLVKVIDNFQQVSAINQHPVHKGRGVMCDQELRAAELTHSALYARALDRFLFEDDSVGACLHQFPVCRSKQGICRADIYIAPLNHGLPCDPVALSDIKMEGAIDKAVRETAGYSVKAMEVSNGVDNWTVQLGLAATTSDVELFVLIGSDRILRQVKVCEAKLSDTNTTKAFFSVLFGAVHYLIQHPITTTSPFMAPMRDFNVFPLGVTDNDRLTGRERVFVNKQSKTVYKLYDSDIKFHQNLLPNVDIIQTLGDGYLPNLSLEHLTDDERVKCLRYDYIEGVQRPQSLRQFADIVRGLDKLHAVNYVHGDIRKENLLFSKDGKQAWIIDFDLAGREGSLYPRTYNHVGIDERHVSAHGGCERIKDHDLHALSVIIEKFFKRQGLEIAKQLKGRNPNLLRIAQTLEKL